MKVLMLNGSAKANGNTYASLLEVGRQLEKEGLSMKFSRWAGNRSETVWAAVSVQRTAVCLQMTK